MSHILKALRKSQMERELGQIPSIKVSYPSDAVTPPRARRWPWILGLALLAVAVLGSLGLLATYAWDLAAPGTRPVAADRVGQENQLAAVSPSTSPSPAILPQKVNTAVNDTPGSTTENLAVLTETLPLAPKNPQRGTEAGATPTATREAPPDLTRPLSASQLPAAAKTPGTGAERHGFPIVVAGDAVPGADPDTVAMAQGPDAADPGQAATSRVAVPEAQGAWPQAPRRRPADAIWVATISAARAASAARNAARNPAPLPPLTAAREVPSAPVTSPQAPAEGDRGTALSSDSSEADTLPQSAYAPPRMTTALGALDSQNEDASAAAGDGRSLPRFEQLPNDLRSEIPQVRLSAHVYDPDPQRRFARINKKKVREGEEVAPGLWLEAVTEEGIVLRYDDTSFRVSSF